MGIFLAESVKLLYPRAPYTKTYPLRRGLRLGDFN
jgi:hypothetical protein